MRTYDIINAGPRNRFMANGRIVSNSGRLFQPQNLPRPTMPGSRIENGIAAMKAGCEDLLFANVSELCSNAVRGCIVAPPGRKLLVADLSNIEGRLLAWLADEQWKIEAFKAFDRGDGHDIYKLTAGRILGKAPEHVTKDERQAYGKVPELALGYQGAVGAFRKMAANYGVDLGEGVVMGIVRAWRDSHPRIRKMWYAMEDAAVAAVENPHERFDVGKVSFDLVTDTYGVDWLRMKLPSGRYLTYARPLVEIYPCERCNDKGTILFEGSETTCPECGGHGGSRKKILTFEGLNQYTRKWERLTTYGGSLCIAKGTLVLTDHGWLPIEQVENKHRVWDGVSWSSHAGLVSRGVKGVCKAYGVWMTPDHEVLTTKGWRRASQSKGLDRAACRLPDDGEIRREQRSEIAVGNGLRLRERESSGGFANIEAVRPKSTLFLWLQNTRDHIRRSPFARHVEAQRLRRVAQHERSLPPALPRRVEELRCPGHSGMRILASVLRSLLGRHGAVLPRRFNARSRGQRRTVLAGKLPLGFTPSASQKYPVEPPRRDAVGGNDRGRIVRRIWYRALDFVLPCFGRRQRQPIAGAARHDAEVFDILDCGPLRRFVVADEHGKPLIVHNCENMTQAAARDVFMSGVRRAEAEGYEIVLRVHDELIVEVPDSPEFTAQRLSEIMATNPGWSAGLPLAATGFECYRYKKED